METVKVPKELEGSVNKVQKRYLFLPPGVIAGKEKEACLQDFDPLGSSAQDKGQFGVVFKVRHKQTKSIYALKIISKSNIKKWHMLNEVKREVKIMYCLTHPNIVKLYNHFEDDANFYLVLEWIPDGNLYRRLHKKKYFDERTTASIIRQLILALEYLHSLDPPIIHRDIKPENILLNGENIKLADFGWSNYFREGLKRKTFAGTPDYLPPEMIDKKPHDLRLDIWNVGVLMFELLTGKAPFSVPNQSEQDLYNNIVNLRITYPQSFPPLAKDLIGKLLKRNPTDRLPLADIKNHPWLVKYFPRDSLHQVINPGQKLPLGDNDTIQDTDYVLLSKGVKNQGAEVTPIEKKVPKIQLDIFAQKKTGASGKGIQAIEEKKTEEASSPLKMQAASGDTSSMSDAIDGAGMFREPVKRNSSKFENEIKSLKAELTRLKKENSDNSGELSNTKQKLEQMTEENQTLKTQRESNEEQLTKLTESEKELKDQVMNLQIEKSNLGRIETDRDNQLKTIQRLQADLESAKSELNKNSLLISDLRQRVEEQNMDRTRLQQKLREAESSSKQLREYQREAEQLREELSTAKADIKTPRGSRLGINDNPDLEEFVSWAKNEIRSVTQRSTEARNKAYEREKDLEDKILELEETISSLRVSHETKIYDLQDSLRKTFNEKTAELEKQGQDSESHLRDSYETQLREFRLQMMSFKKDNCERELKNGEIDRIKEENKFLKRAKDDLSNQSNLQAKLIDGHKKSLESKESDIAELAYKLGAANIEIAQKTEWINSLTQKE